MNMPQYKRLLGVLIIPLAALGFWLAKNEILIENHHQTLCEEFERHFNCVSIDMSEKKARAYKEENGGVYLWKNAHLYMGFNESVISTGIREMEYINGSLQEKQTIGAGVKKVISIEKNAGANYSGNGPCTLSLHANSEKQWNLSCLSGMTESFTFPDSQTNEKYLKLVNTNIIENQRYTRNENIIFFASLLTPLLAFLFVSAIAYAATKITKFVIHGRKQSAKTSL